MGGPPSELTREPNGNGNVHTGTSSNVYVRCVRACIACAWMGASSPSPFVRSLGAAIATACFTLCIFSDLSNQPTPPSAPTLRMAKHVCVGVDGSEIAHLAFQTALHLRKGDDTVSVVHVSDSAKSYLPYDLQPDYIKQTYEVILTGNVPSQKYNVDVVGKREGQSTKGAVCQYVNEGASSKVDLFVVGCAGRKGPKTDATVLGSTTDYSLRSAHCTSVIVNKHIVEFATAKERRPASFLVCVDGSKNSENAYKEAARLAHKGDKVVVVHIVEDEEEDGFGGLSNAEEVQAKFVEEHGCESFEFVEKVAGRPLAQQICDMAWDREVDFVVVGADGMTAFKEGRNQLGSVSEFVVKNAKCGGVVITEVL